MQKTLLRVPPKYKIWSRDLSYSIELGGGEVYIHNFGGAPNVIDSSRKERRPATMQDVADMTRLLDAMPNVHSVTSVFVPPGIPQSEISARLAATVQQNTTKPIYGSGLNYPYEVDAVSRIMAAPMGGIAALVEKPRLTICVSPISPLKFPAAVAATISRAADLGLPVGILPCPIPGVSAPITIAGGLALQHAENLAGILIAQLVRPGVPCLYHSRLSIPDPKKAVGAGGSPEMGMAGGAAAQLAKYHHIPCDVYGVCTSSKTLDSQAGFEKAINGILPALMNADQISGVGIAEDGMSGAYDHVIMDNEIYGEILHLRRGIKVNLATLALDAISEAVAQKQEFYTLMHTVEQLRAGALYEPALAHRGYWDAWEAEGKNSYAASAAARVKEILATHEVPPLPDGVVKEMEAAIEEAKAARAETA
ncbi:MAG: trimethylamine methyltransferase family protein [Candidatus Lindowbacteria bacterium]|nr:trimethylamine methyltransferase family protein [Candidatus Lindowbacteria bacterium]